MSLVHHFNVQVAEELGVNAAILAANVQFWCAKNEANESKRHFHDGRYWTFNSRSALTKLFPYLSEKQIRGALDKCVEAGLLICGNYNNDKRDRTKWYSYNGLEWSLENTEGGADALAPEGQSHWPLRADPLAPEGQPLPDTNPDNKPDNKLSAQARTSLVRGLARLSREVVAEKSVDVLLSEASGFDGYRILIETRFMFDRLNEQLGRHLKAINLKLVNDPDEMMISEEAA